MEAKEFQIGNQSAAPALHNVLKWRGKYTIGNARVPFFCCISGAAL
jgi:hypothetical protein